MWSRLQPATGASAPAPERRLKSPLQAKACSTLLLLFAALPALAAIEGTVINATTGKPEAGVTVNLLHPGEQGMQMLGTAKSGADGAFRIDKDVPSPPALLQGLYQGSTYNLIIPPGSPSTGLKLNVYDSTTDSKANKLALDMIIIEPGTDALHVSERYEIENPTTTTFEDPLKGSLQFYLPDGAQGGTSVTVQAPDGMPINRPAEKATRGPNIYKINYPLKPGKTGFEFHYTLPAGDTFKAQRMRTDAPTRLVTPPSGDAVR